MKELIEKLASEGGCIVSSADCTIEEISNAHIRRDIHVDTSGFGYIRRPPEWLQRHDHHCRGGEEFPCIKPSPESKCEWVRGTHHMKVEYMVVDGKGEWWGFIWTPGDPDNNFHQRNCKDAGEAIQFCLDELSKRV
jgi:hypothetical protein